MVELDIRNSQHIAAQLDTLYEEIGLDQSPQSKLQILLGEVQEVVEAHNDYSRLPCPEHRKALAGELADVLFCTLSTMNDFGIDAVEAMNYVFDKNLGRVNREHIANTKAKLNGSGDNPKMVYKAAKAEHDKKYL